MCHHFAADIARARMRCSYPSHTGATPQELQLRLTGGGDPFNGTLEIYHAGKWGLVW